MQYFFADEAGNLDFSDKTGASKYLVVCTTLMDDPSIGEALLALRRDMVWRGLAAESELHATEDKQAVRDEVFNLIQQFDFRIDATVLEKSKAQPQTRESDVRFLQYAWYYHFKHIAPRYLQPGQDVLVEVSGWGTKKKRSAFRSAVNDVLQQCIRAGKFAVAFWPNASDPCLQITDYCTWAIQRGWERNDLRSYDLIKDKIGSEYDLWRTGTQHYY